MKKKLGLERIPLPKGFLASGVNCGVRKYRPDLGILISDPPAKCTGLFTKNRVKAAPVLYCEELLPKENIKAVVTNSGQANAGTGKLGESDNKRYAQGIAQLLECDSNQIVTASTGVIGERIDISKMENAYECLYSRLQDKADSFALSIMTTDLVPKSMNIEMKLSEGTVNITGIAKGSGMIHPNMGTMLAYITTDANISINHMDTMIRESTDLSFNMISVDGETSTNDSVFFLANGASGIQLKTDDDKTKFHNAVTEICIELAKAIARDGEGASKLIQVEVMGASTIELARKSARDMVMSSLIKTAVHGEDPNWGRILARIGNNVPVEWKEEKCKISMQDILVFEGKPVHFNMKELIGLLKKDTVNLHIDLGDGSEKAIAWGCDLTKEYITINAEYN